MERSSKRFSTTHLWMTPGADGRTARSVLTGAVIMQVQSWKKIGPAVLVGAAVLAVASWWVGQRPYISPGTHLVLSQDSNSNQSVM